MVTRLATSRPFRSEKVVWSDEVARASAQQAGENYWKGLLESLYGYVYGLLKIVFIFFNNLMQSTQTYRQ